MTDRAQKEKVIQEFAEDLTYLTTAYTVAAKNVSLLYEDTLELMFQIAVGTNQLHAKMLSDRKAMLDDKLRPALDKCEPFNQGCITQKQFNRAVEQEKIEDPRDGKNGRF